jgi:alpha-glucosidase
MEFPDEQELFGVDRQFLVGGDILVTSVLEPNVTSVDGKILWRPLCRHPSHVGQIGIFPGRGSVIWRDWWTHEVLQANSGTNTTLSAPLSHINVHIRDNSILLLHQNPAYTIFETRQGPYSLLVSLNKAGQASGDAFVDDGESYPPGPSRRLRFEASKGEVKIASVNGTFAIAQKLDTITVLGVGSKPKKVSFGGKTVGNWTYGAATEELVASGLGGDLNKGGVLSWS